MLRFTIIVFLLSSFMVKGQMTCNGTLTPNQFFYSNTVSTGTPQSGGAIQLLCGPNTIVYDTLTAFACYWSYLNPNCTLTINEPNCPGPSYYWLKAGSVLNIGPNASFPIAVFLESGAIVNNPFSVPTGTASCPVVTFPNSNCITGINEYNKNNFFQVYPNPSSSKISIDLAFKNNNLVNIIITNQLGELFYENNHQSLNIIEIPIDNLSMGLYFVQIKTIEGIQTKKINVIR